MTFRKPLCSISDEALQYLECLHISLLVMVKDKPTSDQLYLRLCAIREEMFNRVTR